MNAYAATTRRLGLAADIFDARAHHADRALIGIVTEGFRSAAGAFEDTAPTAPGDLPEDLCDAVAALEIVFQAHDFHLSAALVGYAIAPAADEVPPMEALGAVSKALAYQDLELRNRRAVLLDSGALDSPDDETTSWALRALATVHHQHERLAAEVAADNAKPGNQNRGAFQPIPGARTAPDHRNA